MSFEKDIKILVVGNGNYDFYDIALYNALCQLNYNAELFTTRNIIGPQKDKIVTNFIKRVQSRLNCGTYLKSANRALIQRCKISAPDIIFFYNTRIYDHKTIDRIKQMGIKIIAFSNDDPFSKKYPNYWWKKFLYIAKNADLVYAYRQVNLDEYKAMGCKKAELLLPYYIEENNHKISQDEKLDNVPDVVYIGHVENDGRAEYINALLRAGIKVGIKADTAAAYEQNGNLIPLKDTFKNYNAIIASAKIALVFLSTKNRDKYTRRCFEIPATGTMMLSIYTEKLAEFFEPDKQAVYFKNPQELVEKCKACLENEALRAKIAQAGYDRLIKDGHEIKDRAEQIMKDCKKLF